MNINKIFSALAASVAACLSFAQNNIAEEVAWTIGDEPIYKSEIEQLYLDYLDQRIPIKGDPYCVLPEQIAVERLFLHQADIDTIEAQPSVVQSRVDDQINFLISQIGSREKVEQYFRKTIPDLRELYTTQFTNQSRVQQVQQNVTDGIKASPSEVRKYFNTLAQDSVPFVPMQVEVQIITINPIIPQEEIDNTKARLREFSDRVTKGETQFSTLAILYSEDPESAKRGGELGFMGRGQLVPEYAAVAFNLNDPNKVSKIVETEYGYHIIQLIEKRGDRINTRHILLRPKVAEKDLVDAIEKLDSVRSDIVNGNLKFEAATRLISQDKDTRLSNGVMVNGMGGSTRFEMSELPQEIAKAVSTMQPGEISQAFIMKDPKKERDIVAIVKLTNRIDAHRANLSDDYQLIANMYENHKMNDVLKKWIDKKIKDTYVRIEDGWRGCQFEHEGWIK